MALGFAGAVQSAPRILGNFWLSFPVLESVGVVGPSGVVTTMTAVPNIPRLVGLHISRQAVVMPAIGGALRFSNPATFAIRL